MMSGYERYYQIARCFRDEDTRADRQAEFTQLDVEMAFVEEDDVLDVMERLMARVFAVAGFDVPPPPWERLPFDEVLLRYGSDRPDRRFGLEIHDVSERCTAREFKVFQSVLDAGGVVRAINAGAARAVALGSRWPERGRPRPRRQGGRLGVRGGGRHVALADREVPGEERTAAANHVLGRHAGRPAALRRRRREVAATALGGLRLELGRRFGLIPDGAHDVHWVVDFPMFGWNEEEAPGTRCTTRSPRPPARSTTPARCARARTTSSSTAPSWAAGRSASTTRPCSARCSARSACPRRRRSARFGFLLDALRYGAPPHGGIAFGIDRVVAVLGGRDSIRDVIAFPKTATGQDPLTGAPAEIDERQLRELGLRPR